jgi:hypothetical protein
MQKLSGSVARILEHMSPSKFKSTATMRAPVRPMSPLYRHAKRFRKLLAAFLSILASQYAYAKQIDIESMLRKSEVEQRPIPLVVPMGDHFNVSATAEATKEGNGTLTIGNLTLRLQDHHDDGLVYGSKGYHDQLRDRPWYCQGQANCLSKTVNSFRSCGRLILNTLELCGGQVIPDTAIGSRTAICRS